MPASPQFISLRAGNVELEKQRVLILKSRSNWRSPHAHLHQSASPVGTVWPPQARLLDFLVVKGFTYVNLLSEDFDLGLGLGLIFMRFQASDEATPHS